MNWAQVSGVRSLRSEFGVLWALETSFFLIIGVFSFMATLGIHSVVSPQYTARNSTLYSYQTPTIFPSIKRILGSAKIKEYLLSRVYRSVFQVCFLYNARINEILSLTSEHILSGDRVLCSGSKRSYDYVIWLPGVADQINESGFSNQTINLFSPTYIQLYKAARKVGIGLKKKETKNVKRLHSSRYVTVSEIKKVKSNADCSGVLRHKSKGTQLYYQ